MTTMVTVLPSLIERLLSATCYVGMTPLVRIWRGSCSRPLLDHHASQATAAFALVLLALFAVTLFDIAECVLLVQFPTLGLPPSISSTSYQTFLDSAMRVLSVSFGLAWMISIGLALAGSSFRVPLLKRLSRCRWVVRPSLVVNSISLGLVPILAGFAFYSSSLTQTNHGKGEVYFLYDDGIPVPRWGYAMGLFRISAIAHHKWGAGSVVLDQLDVGNLRMH
jgi:hypothetical protein